MIYFFRILVLVIGFIQGSINHDLETSLRSFGIFMVTYFSMLAIFNLMASFTWKRLSLLSDNLLNISALFISCIVFFIRLPSILLVFGLVAFLFLMIKAYDNYRNRGAILSRMFIIYTLILLFWFFDLVPITQEILRFELLIAGYVASVCIFLYINYRINKVLRPD